jgi:P-type Cu+ transporter
MLSGQRRTMASARGKGGDGQVTVDEQSGQVTAARAEVRLAISGMTCAACAARIARKLNAVDDVSADVNFATGKAIISVPVQLPPAELVGVVVRAGYGAEVIAAGSPTVPGDLDAARVRDLRRRLIVAAVLLIPLTDLSVLLSLFPQYRFPGWQWMLVVAAAPVAGWAAWPFHRAALKNARHRSVTMDTLISLGIAASCGWSLFAMFVLDHGQGAMSPSYLLWHASGGGVYLEVASMVTTFLLAGRFYEAKARRDAGDAMRELAAVEAADACVLREGGSECRIPVSGLAAGERIVVRPGERIAADGEVEFGRASVDRAMMTGESVPVDVAVGDAVTGGTIVLDGRIIVRARRVGEDTQLAHLIALVEHAQAEKASVQRAADRIAGVFVPVVMLVAAATLAGWLLTGHAAGRSFSAALAVLIIACPCALGLATPAALVVACGAGAQLGIFIKGYHGLETSRAVDTVVLDKTGTLTAGRMTVADFCASAASEDDLLRCAGAVERASEHAIGRSIAAFAEAQLGAIVDADDFAVLPGGARGKVGGRDVVVGSEKVFAELAVDVPAVLADQASRWEASGRTVVYAGWDCQVRGCFALADTIKPSAAAAVADLRNLGLRTILLTGDSAATASMIGASAGVDDVIAGALPAEKVDVIRELQRHGHLVAMVGDGVNDGPALAAADLGLALGSGTDVALTAADLIVLRDDLTAVPDAIRLARSTFRTIRQNLAWAFAYNVAAIPLAAAGFLNPVIAGAAMTISSVFVVSNSVRLRRFAPKTASHEEGTPDPEKVSADRASPASAGIQPGQGRRPYATTAE